ncbi:MAG TPA: HAMP domain-containing sensor histidine kinase [Anaerolineales bacterium]|nr:HAMP domain-containing sensor histidine kinase [Anaerolineales bacterium]
MSIRFKVIFPYLLLTLIVAVTGAYVVTRLVSNSLSERLSNQLLESGRVVSDVMARTEIRHLESARIVAFTRGLGAALRDKDAAQVVLLAKPAAGGLNVESLMVFDSDGLEAIHLIKQTNGTIMDVSQPGRAATLSIVQKLLAESNPDSLPKRALTLDPVDGRYYYFTTIPVASEGRVVGAVVVGTSLNTLLPYLKSTSLADVIIYGENGQAIVSSLGTQGNEPVFLRTISIPNELYQEILMQDDIVQGENFEADGRWYSLARASFKVGDDRLGVFSVVLPMDFVVESGSVNRNNYVILYAIAMAAVILIGYFIARLIINPLYKLVRTSRAIADGDLTRRTEIESRDEIGVLANSFDTMTENLQQRTLELERTYKILEQMDRAKTKFIQVTAHELRTPMTLVQGYAQMVQMKSNGNAEISKYSNGIVEGSNRMVEVIDSMLDVTRIDNKQLEIGPEQMQIDDVIEKVRRFFETALGERKIKLVTNGLTDLPEIRADKGFIYKVFYHVIGNAIKYTPDGGKVSVTGRTLQEAGRPAVEIVVKDTGIGIDSEYQQLVFEKFYQTGEVLLHSSGKTKFKGGGPGLGLAIARGIVDAHQGRIWLESPGHNEKTNPGTTVFVRLPVDGPVHEPKSSEAKA